MMVQEHALARNGNACKAAALIPGRFGNKEVAGPAQAQLQVFGQLPAPQGRRVRSDITAFVVIPPGVEGRSTFILG